LYTVCIYTHTHPYVQNTSYMKHTHIYMSIIRSEWIYTYLLHTYCVY
jgi:hypothetical protein